MFLPLPKRLQFLYFSVTLGLFLGLHCFETSAQVANKGSFRFGAGIGFQINDAATPAFFEQMHMEEVMLKFAQPSTKTQIEEKLGGPFVFGTSTEAATYFEHTLQRSPGLRLEAGLGLHKNFRMSLNIQSSSNTASATFIMSPVSSGGNGSRFEAHSMYKWSSLNLEIGPDWSIGEHRIRPEVGARFIYTHNFGSLQEVELSGTNYTINELAALSVYGFSLKPEINYFLNDAFALWGGVSSYFSFGNSSAQHPTRIGASFGLHYNL